MHILAEISNFNDFEDYLKFVIIYLRFVIIKCKNIVELFLRLSLVAKYCERKSVKISLCSWFTHVLFAKESGTCAMLSIQD